MIHEMRLDNEPFLIIKNGKKRVELRLYDEKRRKIKEKDLIIFTNRKDNSTLKTKVTKLHIYPNFKKLYDNFNKEIIGYKKNKIKNYKDMEEYYKIEDINKYGVVGIEFKIISDLEFIKTDPFIIDIYNKIHKFEDENKGWAYHDYNHVLNVADIVENILSMLNYDEELINSAKIASILHDTGALQGKDNHAFRSYELAKKYFEKNNINLENKEQVLEAIRIHSDGFDTDNMIALALILADKLDVKYTRVTEEGKKIIGNRQFCNIEDINVNIENDVLIFNFKTNSKLNIQELNEYYFTKKIFKAVDSFCNKVNKKYKITINDEEWTLLY